MMKRIPLVAALMWAGVTHTAHAEDLLQSWQAAQQHHPDMAAARAVYEQAALRQDQARALWNPVVNASGALGLGGMNTKTTSTEAMDMSPVTLKTSIHAGLASVAGLTAQKAWISPEREAQARQLELSAQIALAQWQLAEQCLMLQTAQRYFQVAQAEHALKVMQRQLKVVEKAALEIAKRQSLGDASTMDLQEINACLSDIRAQVLALENQLATAQVSYQQGTGLSHSTIKGLSSASPALNNLEDSGVWVQRALQQMPNLQILSLQQKLQSQEAKRIKAADALSISWIAQAQINHASGHGSYGSNAVQDIRQYMVGMQLNAPLSTGGLVDAREREALKQAEKFSYDEMSAKLQVEQTVRDAWQNLKSASNRLKALEQSFRENQSRLAATRSAHLRGARTTNEWLNAERSATQAELSFMQARIHTAMERIRLNAAAGSLDETKIREVNSLLE